MKNEEAPGQHKTRSIIVNGRQREVSEHKLTYLQVIQLAYPDAQLSEKTVFTITFSNPHGKDGTMVEGDTQSIKDGMIINVGKTDQS